MPELGSAAAVARADRRPATPEERRLADEHAERIDAWHRRGDQGPPPSDRPHIVGEDAVDGPEHGVHRRGTWCGLPVSEVAVLRHTFHPEAELA